MTRIAAICLALALAGCCGPPLLSRDADSYPPATYIQGPPEPEPEPPAAVKQVCLPFTRWSPDDFKALGAELKRLPRSYVTLRRAALEFRRYYGDDLACLKAQK
ncbi:MAG TPA: hypothetical protein VG867_02970 [Rhizomicrobium sp.]|nr:hypothetical protein [Rhizomicrobium sp.]